MERYVCFKGFQLPMFDENMSMTDLCGEVQKCSVWEISNSVSESEVRLDKVGGFSDFSFIDVSRETLRSNFSKQE